MLLLGTAAGAAMSLEKKGHRAGDEGRAEMWAELCSRHPRAGDPPRRDLGRTRVRLRRLLYTWRDGKLIEARSWISHAEALEAAGLAE
jgi:hypothetical protein